MGDGWKMKISRKLTDTGVLFFFSTIILIMSKLQSAKLYVDENLLHDIARVF